MKSSTKKLLDYLEQVVLPVLKSQPEPQIAAELKTKLEEAKADTPVRGNPGYGYVISPNNNWGAKNREEGQE